jgi:hypothetical protein
MIGFELGFPRDGTSRDKNYSLSRCPFVPGEGQEQKSWDILLCPGTKSFYKKKQKTGCFKTGKGHSKTGKDVLKQEKDVLKQEKMF